jgi:hypothetical protein
VFISGGVFEFELFFAFSLICRFLPFVGVAVFPSSR